MEEEKHLFVRLKNLAGRGFGCTTNQIHRVAVTLGMNILQVVMTIQSFLKTLMKTHPVDSAASSTIH
jgi:hypothetical protein